MGKSKTPANEDLIPLAELNQTISDVIEDAKYKVDNGKRKSPKTQRQDKQYLRFWTSIKHHLNNK